MARPSKLTPEVTKRLTEAIRAGNYYEAACGYAGIHYSTFRKWMIKGEKAKSGKYREFFEAVTRAEYEAEVRMVAQWQKHMPGDYRAIRDFLERRYPERWGKRIDVKQDIKQEVQGQVTQRHEYDITHRIEQYADVYRQLARRGVLCGSDEGDDTGEQLDTT